MVSNSPENAPAQVKMPIEVYMYWAWCLGMLVLSGIPAIIGGGIAYAVSGSWNAVIGWEAVLLCLLIPVLIKGGRSAKVKEAAEAVAK